jgi:serine/threonine protein kinase
LRDYFALLDEKAIVPISINEYAMSNTHLDEEAIFDLARKIESPMVRADYRDQVCGTNDDLKGRLAELLTAYDASENYLEGPPADLPRTSDLATTEKQGDNIGPFKLLQKIGEGGFGVVYMAEQTQPIRRKVALKVIKPGMDTKEVIARFEAERQALAMMNHPNIAKVFDGGETQSGRPYFVMELVRGIPVTEYCDQHNLDTKQRLRLFGIVCRAIQHAHQKGVIHRDIKPSNVMVTLHDGNPVPKVIDFGVAKAINQQLTEKTLFTQYGQMVGTPQYMSPEQAEMSGLDVDTRSDIYSLGVLLYELLTGTTPLEPETLRKAGLVEMQRLIEEQDPPKPSTRVSDARDRATAASQRGTTADSLRRSLRGELDWVVMKALEKDRSGRYETANGLALDVERFLAAEPVSAVPSSASYRLHKMVSRNRGLAIGASVTTSALLLALVASVTGYLRVHRTAEELQVANVEAKQHAENATRAEQAAARSAQEAIAEADKAQLFYNALPSKLSLRVFASHYRISRWRRFVCRAVLRIVPLPPQLGGHPDNDRNAWSPSLILPSQNQNARNSLNETVFGTCEFPAAEGVLLCSGVALRP